MNLIALLEEWEQWEADLINDNSMWWPYVEKDKISGKTYDKMMELQEKRKQALNYLRRPDPFCNRCQRPLSRCRCSQ